MELVFKEADRWLRQAEYDLKAADWNLEGGYHFAACFWAQQAAGKAIRAFLFYNKEDTKETRSVVELLERAITYKESFKELVEPAGRLDLYYKTSRFPDAIPGGIPAEVFTSRDAREAVRIAGDIIRLVEDVRKDYIPETL